MKVCGDMWIVHFFHNGKGCVDTFCFEHAEKLVHLVIMRFWCEIKDDGLHFLRWHNVFFRQHLIRLFLGIFNDLLARYVLHARPRRLLQHLALFLCDHLAQIRDLLLRILKFFRFKSGVFHDGYYSNIA